MVTGPGDPTGDALINHPMVDKISFTGSRAVGRKIIEASASTFKRVSLELGGKSPALVFADGDASTAAAITMGTVTLGLSGQVCLAQTRALVHRDKVDEFLGMAEMIAGMVSYGNPFDPAVTASPLINTRQLDRVLGLIGTGQEEGARLVCGGTRGDGDLADGDFVAPTLFTDVHNDMTIAREEIFGPVLSVLPFTDEDEAIAIANTTEYGLAATVWTNDIKRGLRMTKALAPGTVGINGYALEPHAPFGGYQQSGIGREGGRTAIESYTEVKTVLIPTTDEMRPRRPAASTVPPRAGPAGGPALDRADRARQSRPLPRLPRPAHWVKPMVSVARASVSSQANPAGGGSAASPAGNTGSSAGAPSPASTCRRPSRARRPGSRSPIRGGVHDRGDAAVHHEHLAVDPGRPPGWPGRSPAARRARGQRVRRAPGAAPIRPAVMAVRARGQMALARTPYRAQLRAVVTVSAAIPALAAA